MGILIGIGNFSGAIASNLYLAKDAPHYVFGRAYLSAFQSLMTS